MKLKYMKNIIKQLGIILIWTLFIYGWISFIILEANPLKWDIILRLLLVWLGPVLGIPVSNILSKLK